MILSKTMNLKDLEIGSKGEEKNESTFFSIISYRR